MGGGRKIEADIFTGDIGIAVFPSETDLYMGILYRIQVYAHPRKGITSGTGLVFIIEYHVPAAEKGESDRPKILYINVEAVDGPGYSRRISVVTAAEIQAVFRGNSHFSVQSDCDRSPQLWGAPNSKGQT
jgi:hypothetical protein